jgi:hypothetical protein
MQNRIDDTAERPDRRNGEPHPVGEVLEELLAQYEARYPGIRVTIAETVTTAA